MDFQHASPQFTGRTARGAMCALAALCMLASCAAQSVDWPAYGGGADEDHYSALKQISRDNVSQLRQAWIHDTGEKGNLEVNPVIVGRTLYALTPTLNVIALDAATG